MGLNDPNGHSSFQYEFHLLVRNNKRRGHKDKDCLTSIRFQSIVYVSTDTCLVSKNFSNVVP